MGSFDLQEWTRIGTMNQRVVRGMFVKGMNFIPLTLIPLTVRFMERLLPKVNAKGPVGQVGVNPLKRKLKPVEWAVGLGRADSLRDAFH